MRRAPRPFRAPIPHRARRGRQRAGEARHTAALSPGVVPMGAPSARRLRPGAVPFSAAIRAVRRCHSARPFAPFSAAIPRALLTLRAPIPRAPVSPLRRSRALLAQQASRGARARRADCGSPAHSRAPFSEPFHAPFRAPWCRPFRAPFRQPQHMRRRLRRDGLHEPSTFAPVTVLRDSPRGGCALGSV